MPPSTRSHRRHCARWSVNTPWTSALETDVINANIQKILDVATLEWGVEVNLVELKDIQLPDSMKRAMARQAEAEREKRQNYCRRRRIDGRSPHWGKRQTR